MNQRKQNKQQSNSLDYPLYEKMKKKAPRAAIFWMAGDRLYHLGLMMTLLSIPLLFIVYTQWGTGEYLVWSVCVLLVSVVLAASGIYLKRESYKLAVRAGVDITKM